MENLSSAQLPKMDPEEYDLLSLGGGTGSTIAAWTFAKQGQRVAAVDRKYVGGSCPNIACLPSKNVIHSAKVASYFRRSDEFGIARKDFTVDMSAVRARKRRMVSGWNKVYLENYKNSGAEFILGSGRFIGPKTLEVKLRDGTIRHLRGAKVIINTGTRAVLELVPGLVDARPLTHIEALELDEVLEHLFVIGGGYIGLELSQAMRRFGSKVTVIDRNDRLMHREDDDVTDRLFKIPMEAVMRASTLDETRGFLKALVETDGDRILGFTGLGVGAGEALASVQIAMLAGLPYYRATRRYFDSPDLGGGFYSVVLLRTFGATISRWGGGFAGQLVVRPKQGNC
jgi:pyruvate/2-oxoglutarate dehydrogenase complex dihydrolipoamide dehydrogenase (E3) component